MNAHELRKARWQRLEETLKREVVDADQRAHAAVDALLADMAAKQEAGVDAKPSEGLIEELLTAAARRRVLVETVLPLVERRRVAAFAQHMPLPAPARR